MAINLNEEVSSRMDAYRANPGALQKRYQSNQELLDLLALQKLTSEKKKAQQELQAAMQQNPRTIKQQLEQEALGMTKDEMAQQLGGIGKTIQTQQQKNLQRVAAGGGQPQGLESLTPPNAPRTPQPTQPTARMAGGGIVSLASGGDVPGMYLRDESEEAYKKERAKIVDKLSNIAQPDEYGQWIPKDPSYNPEFHRPGGRATAKENVDRLVQKLSQRLDELNGFIDARRQDYPGDFPYIAPPDVPGSGGASAAAPATDNRTTAPADDSAPAPALAAASVSDPNINLPRTMIPPTDLSGISQLMKGAPYGDGTNTLQQYGLAGLDKQTPVDQAQRQAEYDQRFGRADEAARYADFEKRLTALQDKRKAQDSAFFNKFIRFAGEATKGNSGGYGNFARAYIGGLDRESLRDRQDLMQVYGLYKEGRARDTDLAKAATESAIKDMENYLKIKELTVNAITNDRRIAVDWQRALLQAGVDMRRITSNEAIQQATIDANRTLAEFQQNRADARSNRDNIVKLYGQTGSMISLAVSEVTKRTADILRLNKEAIGLGEQVDPISPQKANALAVMSINDSDLIKAIDAMQQIIVSLGGKAMSFNAANLGNVDIADLLKENPNLGKYFQKQQPK